MHGCAFLQAPAVQRIEASDRGQRKPSTEARRRVLRLAHVSIKWESTMQRRHRRPKERQEAQADAWTNQALIPLHKAAETSSDGAEPAEHTVQYLGWFGLSRRLDSDFEPYGRRSRSDGNPADCSCGCRFFAPLAPASLSKDWGCCLNKKSPRAGLLTFEHQGCREFEYGPGVSG